MPTLRNWAYSLQWTFYSSYLSGFNAVLLAQRFTDKQLIIKPFVCETWLFNVLFNRSEANTLF